MKLRGFTLIELLVVIVIIGILATISVATFSGYFKKARDAERQTFVSAARTAIIADQINANSTVDYNLGGADAPAVETAFKAIMTDQGITIPAGTNAYYVTDAAAGSTAGTFSVAVCQEDDPTESFNAGTLTLATDCGETTDGVLDTSAGTLVINLD